MEYSGSACQILWIWSGGTLDMSAETRALSLSPEVNVFDVTDGSATNRSFVCGPTDWTVDWSGVAQDNSGANAGTLYAQALSLRRSGTLLISPYGTAAHDFYYSGKCFCNNFSISHPYSDVTSLSVSWKAVNSGFTTWYYGGPFVVGLGIVSVDYIG